MSFRYKVETQHVVKNIRNNMDKLLNDLEYIKLGHEENKIYVEEEELNNIIKSLKQIKKDINSTVNINSIFYD